MRSKKLIASLLMLLFLLPLNLSAKDWFGLGADDTDVTPDYFGYAITPEELEGMLYAYADSFQASMFSATRYIIHNTDDIDQRHLATLLRSYSVGSIYDIATNPDPYTKLLDMLLVTTLHSYVIIDENSAEKHFGEHGQILIDAIRQNRLEIWRIAKKVMTAEQLYMLDWLIIDWRRQNPAIDNVSYVRFSDVASSRGKSMIADVKVGSGFLAPVDEAKKALDEARLLAERSFYYAKRAPLLYSWQAETMTDGMLAKPEMKQLLASISQMTDSMERVTSVLESLPVQIREINGELDKRESSLSKLMGEVRDTVADSEQLVHAVDSLSGSGTGLIKELRYTSDSLNQTLQTLDIVLKNHIPKPVEGEVTTPSKPFDITEYTHALTELDTTITDLTKLVDTSDTFILSEDMTERIEQLNKAAEDRVEHATEQSHLLLGMMFFYAVTFSFIIFLLFISYRFMANRKIGASS